MQIETTVTQTETLNVLGQDFRIRTIERSVSVFCDTCPNQAHGGQAYLESLGWSLGSSEQFCPECNY